MTRAQTVTRGFYETAEGGSFTTGWRDVIGLGTEGRVRARGDPGARFTDAQIDALSRVAFTGVHDALIRRLAAEVRALRDEVRREPPGAPGR